MLDRDVASLAAACARGIAAPLLGGAVGFLTYEAARRYERLPARRTTRSACHPSGSAFLTPSRSSTTRRSDSCSPAACIAAIRRGSTQRTHARSLASRTLREAICARRPPVATAPRGNSRRRSRARRRGQSVEGRVSGSRASARSTTSSPGDIFQVQVSRRFALPLQADPFDVYVALRAINPSPYMIYIATPDCTLVGASPEMLVQVTGRSRSVPPDRRHPAARPHTRG